MSVNCRGLALRSHYEMTCFFSRLLARLRAVLQERNPQASPIRKIREPGGDLRFTAAYYIRVRMLAVTQAGSLKEMAGKGGGGQQQCRRLDQLLNFLARLCFLKNARPFFIIIFNWCE